MAGRVGVVVGANPEVDEGGREEGFADDAGAELGRDVAGGRRTGDAECAGGAGFGGDRAVEAGGWGDEAVTGARVSAEFLRERGRGAGGHG